MPQKGDCLSLQAIRVFTFAYIHRICFVLGPCTPVGFSCLINTQTHTDIQTHTQTHTHNCAWLYMQCMYSRYGFCINTGLDDHPPIHIMTIIIPGTGPLIQAFISGFHFFLFIFFLNLLIYCCYGVGYGKWGNLLM